LTVGWTAEAGGGGRPWWSWRR